MVGGCTNLSLLCESIINLFIPFTTLSGLNILNINNIWNGVSFVYPSGNYYFYGA